MRKLHLSKTDRILGGVLGGLGEYLNVDATILRILWVLLTIFTGLVPGVLAYIAFWLIIPQANWGGMSTASREPQKVGPTTRIVEDEQQEIKDEYER